jgi:stress-induced morphogen
VRAAADAAHPLQHRHAGARPEGETHFRVEIVSAAFDGLSRIERQRLVHQLLAAELAGRVHALSLTTQSRALSRLRGRPCLLRWSTINTCGLSPRAEYSVSAPKPVASMQAAIGLALGISGAAAEDLVGSEQIGASDAGGAASMATEVDDRRLWSWQPGTSADDSANGLATDADGNVCVVGQTEGALGGPYKGNADGWVIKFDGGGHRL